MRTASDALRSLNRYVALAFEGWEVRPSNQRGDFYRPFVRVTQIPSLTFNLESSRWTRLTSAYQIVAYPEKQPTVDESQAVALACAETFWNAFAGPGVGHGHPARVPLYDYDGIPYTGPTAAATEGDRLPYDYLKLESAPDIQMNQDQDDDYLWSVAANIRMSWTRSAAVSSTAPMTVSVSVEANETNG